MTPITIALLIAFGVWSFGVLLGVLVQRFNRFHKAMDAEINGPENDSKWN